MEKEVSFAAYLIQLNKGIKFHEDWSFIFKIKKFNSDTLEIWLHIFKMQLQSILILEDLKAGI